ncbi:MAG: uroporphyrinogen decarboxylase [Deltaproteobacteria bacterium]|nr:uroporphyrinogen decarboxylase [Deltaproteobacteria bacterium]
MRRELIFNAFDHQPISRVPVGFWFHLLPEAETGDWRADPFIWERNLSGHQAFIRAFKPDMVKIMSDGFFFYPTPTLRQPLDLTIISALPPSHNWIRAQGSLVRRVRVAQADAAYFYNIFSPITSLRFKIGLDQVKNFHQAQPEAFVKSLGRMSQGLVNLTRAVLGEGGADGIYLSVQNPDQNYFSEDFYRQALVPGEKAIIQAAQELGKKVILHICGYNGVRNHLPLYVDYQADAYNWAVELENVSLKEGRELFGGKTVLGGFANGRDGLLANGDETSIKLKTRELIREAGPLGLIIGADCTLPSDIALERLDWARTAGLEAIRYGGLGPGY